MASRHTGGAASAGNSSRSAFGDPAENVRRAASLEEELLSEEMALLLVRFGVRAMAERRGVSERTLRREFERSGVTVLGHVNRTRRDMAVRLLGARRPMRDVAQDLGFASTQTFDRFIHREFGLTPTGLRRILWSRRRPERA